MNFLNNSVNSHLHLRFNLFPRLENSGLVLLEVLTPIIADDMTFFVQNYESGDGHDSELL